MSPGQTVGLLIAGVFLVLLLALLGRFLGGEGPLPYFSKEFLCSRGELVFYHALRRAVPDDLMICPKVRMADVIGCSGEAWKQGYGGKISQKHVDFVLADADSTAIVMAVELDDRSHQRADRRERDAFVDQAFAAAGIPILHVPASGAYDVKALRIQIAQMVRQGAVAKAAG